MPRENEEIRFDGDARGRTLRLNAAFAADD